MNKRQPHKSTKRTTPGKYTLLGATMSDGGVNFALFSQYAKKVFLLLFDKPDASPTDTIEIKNRTENIWHIFIEGIKAGQQYGYRILGDYDPAHGMRFNENKVLMDPYARALTGKFINTDNLLLGYDSTAADKDLIRDKRDNTSIVPKSVVIDESFDWQGDAPPSISLEDLIIYEVHLKGFTAHSSSGVQKPGTYLGFIEKIPYLKELGINAVELLPLQEFYSGNFLLEKGLTNYWGYNTIGFFAPESSYASGKNPGCQVQEFKTLVRELHKSGIEVILDVVYNHTGEGNELGPTMCFRGIDNSTYYSLIANATEEPYRFYLNDTGCGNTFNIENPIVMRLVLDSLRYWVESMHVDGFRFDLASILARVKGQYSNDSAFFEPVKNDPILSKVKMIAEPWDLTTYQVGNFPQGWSEWNGKYRDTVRRCVKGDSGQMRDLGYRLTGSSDLYADDGRKPYNSINFITCHDGFTLNDLVSYNDKHNEANGEENRDGSNDNSSWNCGSEGETSDNSIKALRRQQAKNMLCYLFFSLGTPMLLGGDEFMRTQQGNNNTYCQDNDINWFNWEFIEKNRDVVDFCKKAIAFKKKYPILRTKCFLLGKDINGNTIPDISWFNTELGSPAWDVPEQRIICYRLDGADCKTEPGDYLLFFILNISTEIQTVTLPQTDGKKWYRIVDTSLDAGEDFLPPVNGTSVESVTHYGANPRSTVILIGE